MTSTLAHGAGNRSLGERAGPLGVLAASPALVILLLAGLGLRLTIAYVLFPSSGFASDVSSYVSWALTLGQHGPSGFYANAGFSDYPPGYLWVLWPIGALARLTADPAAIAVSIVKLPPILVDLAVGYVLYRLVLGWTWPGRASERLALLAAALYVLNPVSIYDSSLWGQTDSVGALVLLLGLAALVRGNSEGAAALGVVAALIKPQFGVVLIPLVAVMLIRRHLARPGSGPRHRPWAPAPFGPWLDAHRGPIRLVTSLLVGLLVFHVLALPFGLDVVGYVRLMASTAGGYAYLTVNAFNPWALVGTDGAQSLAAGLTWSRDDVPFLGPVPAVAVGATVLAAGFLWALARAATRDDRWTLIVAISVLAMGFFVLPTRVHERYLFPAFALLPLVAVASRRWLVAFVLLSAAALVNLHAILTWPIYATENLANLPLGETFRTQPIIVAAAVIGAGVLAFAAWQLRPSLVTKPDGFERAALGGAATTHSIPVPVPAVARARTASPEASVADPAWVRGPGVLDQLALRLTRPPIRRPDRDARREGPGRFDRLDALVLVLLVVAAATLRGFRVDEPYGMYFDEVYHARTATEFLQDWEYGQPHAIYEYTHPHLAKYAMALGISLLGGNRVSGTANLASPVRDAAIESRWAPPAEPGARHGDRLYVATGAQLRILDLASREEVGSLPVSASAVAVDQARHRVYVADAGGAIASIDTTRLDAGFDSLLEPGLLEPFTAGDGSVPERLLVTDISLLSLGDDGRLSAYDIATGVPLADRVVAGAADLAVTPSSGRVVVDREAVGDADTTASDLASMLGADSAAIAAELAAGPRFVVVDAFIGDTAETEVQTAIDDGALAGVSLADGPLVAVAGSGGVSIVDAQTLDLVDELPTVDPVTGLALVTRGVEDPTLYAASGDDLTVIPFEDRGPRVSTTIAMPGDVRLPAWNEPARLVHVAGTSPEGGPTVYVVETHGNAVFADAALPFQPRRLLLDLQPDRPSLDRGQALAIGGAGEVASIDVLREAFGWRFPGVIMGALTAGLIYLLARLLFERRSIGLAAAALVLVEGMLFANSRIAMNDVYVTTFILLAAVLFTPVFTGRVRRSWVAGALLVATGLALGLALASKWVALYAVGGLVLLVLLRSSLGRIVALAGSIAATGLLGALAIRPPETEDPSRNWTFLLLMLLVTGLLAAGIVRRPLPLTRSEALIGGALPILVGAMIAAGSFLVDGPLIDGLVTRTRLLAAGAAACLGGAIVLGIAWWSRSRRGPPSSTMRHAERPSPSPWLTPGRWLGLGWAAALLLLAGLPLVVYVLSYAPWVALGNQWVEGFPAGHTGQTLAELTASMYRYHDELRASHAASSPWWAWPLDLKPVWFFQDGFAGPTTGLIHDTGNLVVFWLGIPAMAFCAWAAWRRRSLGLAIVVILWLALWLPWVRIDRATFQYHVYTSLPFLVIALAYLLAELWRGPGTRTWFLARAAAALAVLGIPLLWLARVPLCRLAGAESAHPGGIACGTIERSARLPDAALGSLLLLALGAMAAAWLVWRDAGTGRGRHPLGDRPSTTPSVPASVILVALATLIAVAAATLTLDHEGGITLTVSPELLAVLGLLVLAPVAIAVLRARDSRRLVLGILAAAAVWFAVWYPNISGLPLPAAIAHVYQGVLPTWNWDFQFAVNLDPATEGSLVDATTFVLAAVATVCAIGSAAAARSWGRRPRVGRQEAPATARSGPSAPVERRGSAPES